MRESFGVSTHPFHKESMQAHWLQARRTTRWLLLALLLAEVALLIGKYDHFFNGDSLFYFSHRVHSAEAVWQKFTGPDHLWQYRPLTFVIFSFFLHPLFGTGNLAYNSLPLLVHMASTILVYWILRCLALDRLAAFLGAFFFGVHSVAFYVTYGVAFLPDFSYAFFYLLSTLFFLKYLERQRWSLSLAAIACFILALFCKEAAITLPPILFVLAAFHARRPAPQSEGSFLLRRLLFATRKTAPFLIAGGLYLVFHWIAKGGQIYALAEDHAHHGEFSLAVLRSKYKYLKWAFNLPDGLIFEFEGWTNYAVAAGIAIFAIPFLWTLCRMLWLRNPQYWLGALWFGIALSPVILLRNVTMQHNLYIPLVGLSFLTGLWLKKAYERAALLTASGAQFMLAAFLFTTIAAAAFHNIKAADSSWIAEASSVALRSLQDLKRQYPQLPENAALCIVNDSAKDLRWFYDDGTLFRLYYPNKSLEVRFVDYGRPLPSDLESNKEWIILLYRGNQLTAVNADLSNRVKH